MRGVKFSLSIIVFIFFVLSNLFADKKYARLLISYPEQDLVSNLNFYGSVVEIEFYYPSSIKFKVNLNSNKKYLLKKSYMLPPLESAEGVAYYCSFNHDFSSLEVFRKDLLIDDSPEVQSAWEQEYLDQWNNKILKKMVFLTEIFPSPGLKFLDLSDAFLNIVFGLRLNLLQSLERQEIINLIQAKNPFINIMDLINKILYLLNRVDLKNSNIDNYNNLIKLINIFIGNINGVNNPSKIEAVKMLEDLKALRRDIWTQKILIEGEKILIELKIEN